MSLISSIKKNSVMIATTTVGLYLVAVSASINTSVNLPYFVAGVVVISLGFVWTQK